MDSGSFMMAALVSPLWEMRMVFTKFFSLFSSSGGVVEDLTFLT